MCINHLVFVFSHTQIIFGGYFSLWIGTMYPHYEKNIRSISDLVRIRKRGSCLGVGVGANDNSSLQTSPPDN